MVATHSPRPAPTEVTAPGEVTVPAPREDTDDRGGPAGHDTPVRPDQAAQLVEAEPVIRRICRSRLGYWDGDDAAQEALTYVWKATQRPDFDDRGTLVPYGVAAARGQVKAGYGWRDRRPLPVGDQVEWGQDFLDDTDGPDEAAQRAEQVAAARARVAALLDGLTPRQREAVTECALRERDTDEVAAELGLSPSSVRSSQVRAMARMREACGTRSTNPLSHGRSAAEQYERNRQIWERMRADREHTDGQPIARRASRHRAAHIAAGRLPADTTAGRDLAPTFRPAPSEPDAVARAAATVARTRRLIAEQAGELDTDDDRRGQLSTWHHDDQPDHDQHDQHDNWNDGDGRYVVAGDAHGGAA